LSRSRDMIKQPLQSRAAPRNPSQAATIPAVFMRGGTSRALFFHQAALPAGADEVARSQWNDIFRSAMGSPDPHGRQLDGMGGGISSLSKVAVIQPSSRDDADVDYTFVQVGITDASVGYRGNCGNISSAVGPFAVDEGLIAVRDGLATVRIYNTNTRKIIVANFLVRDGRAVVEGDFELAGVGPGAKISLVFKDPAGATTGVLLPSGHVTDELSIAQLGRVRVSLVDASNPVVFVSAGALGLSGDEPPDALNTPRSMATFEEVRVAAAVMMGLGTEAEARSSLRNLPLVSIISPPQTDSAHITTRMISMGQPHKATPLTGAMCLAVAAHIPGSVVHEALAGKPPQGDILIGHPSGVLPVSASVVTQGDQVSVKEVTVYRTARRLMEGLVYLRPPQPSDSPHG